MKKISSFLAAVLIMASVIAQSPEKMSYQAVIRNSSNQLMTNQAIGLKINILQGSPSGTTVYVETQNPTTNANGLASIEIGTGAVVSGDFAIIDWTNGPYFLKTETDPTGGTNYTIIGTSQLLSVPYSLYSNTAKKSIDGARKTYVDSLKQEFQILKKFTYSQFPPTTTGLVGYWPFNGNANDESGNNHPGTVNGPVLVSDRFDTPNKAYYFDGINDYISITASSLVDNQTSMTLSFWIKRESNDDYGIIIHTGNQGCINTQVKKDSVTVGICTNSNYDGSAPTEFDINWIHIKQAQWNHILYLYNGTKLKLYINGEFVKEAFAEGNIWSPQSSYLAFGVYFLFGSPDHGYYKGILDDVRLYNRALTGDEIQSLYHEVGW